MGEKCDRIEAIFLCRWRDGWFVCQVQNAPNGMSEGGRGRRLARINEWKMGIAIEKVKEAEKVRKKRIEVKRFSRYNFFLL